MTLATDFYPELIYDVGMHKGEDTAFYLKKGFRVVAFEADPALAEGCRQRFAEALREHRLVVVEGAITDGNAADGTVTFYRNLDNSVWGTTSEDWKRRNDGFGTRSECIRVRAVCFAECIERYGIPHYMKIDIEGADIDCVAALQGFQRRPNYLSIESDKVSFQSLQAEIALLQGLGYNKFQAVQQADVPLQTPPKPAREGVFVPHSFEYGTSGLFGAELSDDWRTDRQIVADYRKIFLGYRIFGDRSPFVRTRVGRRLHRWLSARMGRQIPGWHDLHAKHASVVSSHR